MAKSILEIAPLGSVRYGAGRLNPPAQLIAVRDEEPLRLLDGQAS
jgi:hypothetical protein